MKKFKRKVLAMLMTNNFGSSLRQQLFDGAPFRSSLLYTAIPQRAASGTTGTFTRATTSTWPNNDGYMVTGVAGEIGFVGARRVRNLLTFTEDFSNAAWTKFSVTATAGEITDTAAGVNYYYIRQAGPVVGSVAVCQVKAKAGTRSIMWIACQNDAVFTYFNLGTGQVGTTGAGVTATITLGADGYYLCTIKYTVSAVFFSVGMCLVDGTPNYNGTGTGTLLIKQAQVEDVTAQTTQTAGEYVSVGVESAPYYHGSFVDGVKCFNTDLAGNALPTQYTYDAVSLNGVAGTYVSTPDSVAASITGDIDIRVKVALTDWTPADANDLVAKWSTNNQSYIVRVTPTGELRLITSSDGTSVIQSVSSVATGITNGSVKWVRVTRESATGYVNFYLSDDNITYSLLGDADVASYTGALYEGTAQVRISNNDIGISEHISGQVYRAQIYNGIGGTLAVDFDASRYAGGTTLTGSTGETWTLQGNAVIHPTNSPMLGYSAEGARTNLCLQSNAFTTTWVDVSATLSPVQNVVGPDGATSAWTFNDDSAVFREEVAQDIVLTAAAHTYSVFVKKTTGAQTGYPVLWATTGGTTISLCTIDTTNGVATVWTAYTGLSIAGSSSARCVSYNDNFWRVSLTFTGTAATWSHRITPAGTTNATQATGVMDAAAQASHVFYGAQLELGSFASSYIPTTTAAVTRNADVLTYSSAGNILGTAGWCYAELRMPTSTGGNAYVIDVGSNRPTMFIDSAGIDSLYDGTATRLFGTYTFGTQSKICNTWGGAASAGAIGGAVTTYGFDGDMNTGATISIGCSNASASHVFGTVRNVRIGQRQLSASELQAVTR